MPLLNHETRLYFTQWALSFPEGVIRDRHYYFDKTAVITAGLKLFVNRVRRTLREDE